MAVPAAINTREDTTTSASTSKPSPTPPTQGDAQRQTPPEMVFTPATPSTPLHASNKVDQPLPVPGDKAGEKDAVGASSSKPAGASGTGTRPIDSLTRKLSGRSKTSDKKPSEKNTTTTTPAAAAASSSSRPNTTQTSKKPTTAGPKKKKRSGFNKFLLQFGCLSADELEDPEPRKGTGVTPAKTTPGSSASTPAQTKTNDTKSAVAAPKEVKHSSTPTAVAPKEKESSGTQPAVIAAAAAGAATGAAGVAAVGGNDKDASADSAAAPADGVVVAPHEPTTLPEDETAGLTSSAVQAPGSGSALLSTPVRPSSSRRQSESSPTSVEGERTETSGGYSNISESEIPDESSGAAGAAVYNEEYLEDEYEDDEDRLIAQGGIGIPVDEKGNPAPLLRPMDPDHSGRKCLVLDLDETLLHSSFKMLPSADYIVPVEIESQTHNVYVIKRPGVDHFLTEMGKIYEVVIFTASLSKYADPVLDMLDPGRVVRHRLFRESCYNHKGNYVKDLSQLGRDMEGCIIIDNSPASYIFHPNNAVPVSTWFNDPHDTELTDLCPFLADLATVDDIRGVLDGSI